MPTIGLPQGTLHYREWGAGEPPVVLLHGYHMSGRLWEPIGQRLAGDFRCIAPDLPLGAHPEGLHADADLTAGGLGQLVADFIGALGLDEPTLVGNDSGGAIAQVVAAHHPERVGRLVLATCDAFDNFPPKLFRPLILAAKVPGALNAVFATMRVRALRNLPNAYGLLTHGRLPHELIDEWIATYFASAGVRRDTRKVTAALGDDDFMLDVAARLTAFDKPALMAWAADDAFFPIEHAERLATILPQGRVARIEHSRTWVMLDQPDRTAGLIRAFARETRYSSSPPQGSRT